jgi:uncharacterized membrane-anchored protein YhcB (DUF1043 family)
MADERVFTLIGQFDDRITSSLNGINDSIAKLKRTMSTMTSKRGGGFNDITRSVGKLISSQKVLASSIKEVGNAAKEATGELTEYNKKIGKIASAHYHLARSSQQAGDKLASGYNKAITSIDKLNRRESLMATARRRRERLLSSNVYATSRRGGTTTRTGSTPRTRVVRPSGGDYGSYGGGGGKARARGGSGGDDYDFPMARFTLAFGLSEAIASPITGAITKGFEIGVGMMTKPFQYFASGVRERMEDEMSDLKAAGGFFSINKMAQKKFLETGNFQEAIDFMQKNNVLMAKLAGSLPGSTQDFIEVNKRISDSIATLVTESPEKAMALAEKVRQEETSTTYADIAPITGPASAQKMQDAMQVLMADMTKQTVLAGQGTGSGLRGTMGAYGLPQLTERMLSQQDISMGQMQRYAAIFRDPMIMRNLERELPKIAETMANTPERYEALRVFFQKVLPPELVERYRRTLAGVQETFNTAIFSPETGIFGLGRRLKDLGGKFDEYGRMLDETGKVTEDITKQAKMDLSIYDAFRDVLANVGRVLAPIAENLSLFWDPLLNIGKLLERAREVTFDVVRSFEIYNKSFEKFAKDLSPTELQKFAQTGGKELRASLATIANLLKQFGVISGSEFEGIMDQLVKVDLDGGKIFKQMLDKFLNSKIAEDIGNFIGTLIGTVLKEVSQVTGFISGRIAGSGKLVAGLRAGFDAAGGTEAFKNIFKDVFSMLFKGLVEVIKNIPIEFIVLGVFMATIPVTIRTIAMMIAHKFSDALFNMAERSTLFPKNFGKKVTTSGGRVVTGGASGGKSSAVQMGGLGAGLKPTTQTRGISSAAMRPVGVAPAGYGNIALPGKPVAPVSGLTSPGQAPRIPKLAKAPSFSTLSKVKARGAGTLAAAMVTMSAAAPGLTKGVKNIAKAFPKGAGVMAGLDFALRILSGESVGKAAGGAGASLAGALAGGKAGAAVGTLFGPGVGTAIGGVIGSVAGGILGDQLFNWLMSPAEKQEQAAQAQMKASLQQLEASREKLSKLGVEDFAGLQGVVDPYKLGATVKLLGLEGDKTVAAYQQNVEKARMLADQTQAAKDALFAKVEELKKLGYSPELIWQQTDIQALQKDYTDLQTTLGEATKAVDTTFKEMPQHVSRAIVTNMQKMDLSQAENIIAMKFANMQVPTQPVVKYDWPSVAATQSPNPGKPHPIFSFAFGSPGKSFSSLAGAINFENKHKPPGSHLVIANSSETIIPAAKGYVPKPIKSVSVATEGHTPRNVKMTSAANGYGSYGDTQVVNHINITQQPGQDSKELASLVAYEIVEAMKTVNDANILV